MPKPMSMTVEIEQIAFGRVFQTLDGMPGVINIKIHAHGPRPADALKTKKGNGTARGRPATKELVLKELYGGPQSKAALGELFEANGKKAASVPSTIQKLTKLKHVTSDGKGNYKITAAGSAALKSELKKEDK